MNLQSEKWRAGKSQDPGILSWKPREATRIFIAGEWHNLIYVLESKFAELFAVTMVVKEGQEGLVYM